MSRLLRSLPGVRQMNTPMTDDKKAAQMRQSMGVLLMSSFVLLYVKLGQYGYLQLMYESNKQILIVATIALVSFLYLLYHQFCKLYPVSAHTAVKTTKAADTTADTKKAARRAKKTD